MVNGKLLNAAYNMGRASSVPTLAGQAANEYN
jgi:hypothetical protein